MQTWPLQGTRQSNTSHVSAYQADQRVRWPNQVPCPAPAAVSYTTAALYARVAIGAGEGALLCVYVCVCIVLFAYVVYAALRLYVPSVYCVLSCRFRVSATGRRVDMVLCARREPQEALSCSCVYGYRATGWRCGVVMCVCVAAGGRRALVCMDAGP